MLLGAYTGQEVNASDQYGMTLVEAIWRGINWRCRFRGLEFNKPGILAAIQAFGSSGTPNTAFSPTLANIGNRYSLFAQALLLTAILGNPPSFVQTLTASNSIIAPNSNTEYLMTSKVREAPTELVLLPYSFSFGTAASAVSFTTT